MGKFALRGLAQSMARELAPQGIHVAHFVIDGGIRSAGPAPSPPDATGRMLDPDAIARHLSRRSLVRTAAPGPGRSSCGPGSRTSERRRRPSSVTSVPATIATRTLCSGLARITAQPLPSGLQQLLAGPLRCLGLAVVVRALQSDHQDRLQADETAEILAPRLPRLPAATRRRQGPCTRRRSQRTLPQEAAVRVSGQAPRAAPGAVRSCRVDCGASAGSSLSSAGRSGSSCRRRLTALGCRLPARQRRRFRRPPSGCRRMRSSSSAVCVLAGVERAPPRGSLPRRSGDPMQRLAAASRSRPHCCPDP